MTDVARRVRQIKLRERKKRLNDRSDSLSRKMNRIGDTTFALRARIKQHGDLDSEELEGLTEKIRKLQIKYDELKAKRHILNSGLVYLQINYEAIINDTEDGESIWEVE